MKWSNDKSIRFYRKDKGLKQEELAELLGLKSYEMSFIENKKIIPQKETAEKLAEALGVTIGMIYCEEELELILKNNKKN